MGAPPADTALIRSFGLTVRQQREARNWSQERLAEAANLNRSYIGELERGEAIASLQTLNKLSLALGIALSQLLQETEQLELRRRGPVLNLTAIAC